MLKLIMVTNAHFHTHETIPAFGVSQGSPGDQGSRLRMPEQPSIFWLGGSEGNRYDLLGCLDNA